MLLSDFIKQAVASLSALYPESEARSIVTRLLEERLGVRSYTHIIEPGREVPGDAEPGLGEDLRRLEAGEPLQYVLGFAEFCGRRFRVDGRVLIPRPETEEITLEVCRRASAMHAPRVLDLCTGSGCIAWSIALEVPGADVVGVDLSEDALEVAAGQFSGMELAARPPRFVTADVLAPNMDLTALTGGDAADVIVSNPPYILESEKSAMASNVLDFEPDMALFVPDGDPLRFYRAVCGIAKRFLSPGGFGAVEINEALGPETQALFDAAGFRFTELKTDFRGKTRSLFFCK